VSDTAYALSVVDKSGRVADRSPVSQPGHFVVPYDVGSTANASATIRSDRQVRGMRRELRRICCVG